MLAFKDKRGFRVQGFRLQGFASEPFHALDHYG